MLIKKDESGKKMEPIEEATVDTPSEYAEVIEVFGSAGGEMADMFNAATRLISFSRFHAGNDGLAHAPAQRDARRGQHVPPFLECGPYRGDFNGRRTAR